MRAWSSSVKAVERTGASPRGQVGRTRRKHAGGDGVNIRDLSEGLWASAETRPETLPQ